MVRNVRSRLSTARRDVWITKGMIVLVMVMMIAISFAMGAYYANGGC